MLTIALLFGLSFLQAPQKGTVVGVVKLPGQTQSSQIFHVVLLTPKYSELWTAQVQKRLDNYWEMFKPEFAKNKEYFKEFFRMAYAGALQTVTDAMRRDLGSSASAFMKDTSPSGQFEFRGLPLGTYQVVVAPAGINPTVIWTTNIEVKDDIPVFVDLGKPVS